MNEVTKKVDPIKAYRVKRKRERKQEAELLRSIIEEEVDTFKIDPNGTWNIVRGRTKVQFYPTMGTWLCKNNLFRGGPSGFLAWLRMR